MPIEVEQKYRVASLGPTMGVLAAWKVALAEPVRQVDCYYRHPQRDFAQTDEAFRLRTVGEQNCLTYKGPKLDATTKTRVEEEVGLAAGELARLTADRLLGHLGFEPVATVSKSRQCGHLVREGLPVEIALDQVDHVGTFVELEISTEDHPAAIERAKQVLAQLAQELGLNQVERRSYLELLLEKN